LGLIFAKYKNDALLPRHSVILQTLFQR